MHVDLPSLLSDGPSLAVLAALAAFLEVLPPLGRFIPGHLVVAALGAAAYTNGAPLAWLAGGVLVGAALGDLTNYVRALRHPRRVLAGGGEMWLPGSDMVRLEHALHKATLRTVVLRRFFTRDRALLPLVAGGWSEPGLAYVPSALVACAVWSAVWVAAGYGLGVLTRVLPPALSVGAVVVILMVASRPLAQRPRAQADPDAA